MEHYYVAKKKKDISKQNFGKWVRVKFCFSAADDNYSRRIIPYSI